MPTLDVRRSLTRLATLALLVTGTVACSSHDGGAPTMPSPGITVAAVSFSGTNVGVGGTAPGTVRLSAAAPSTGAAVTLTSSNPSVITVPASVAVAAGADSTTFMVTAVNAGTASIRAAFNGSSAQSAVLTATRSVAVVSLVPASSSVVGGDTLSVTVTLTGPAPAGGAAVSLSGTDPIEPPLSVTVPAGLSSQTFAVLTRAVGGTIAGTLTASYGGGTATTTVSVTRPTTARANFGVTGPNQSDTCLLTNNGSTLDCTFDGSTSTAPGTITSWQWTYSVATARTATTSTAVLSMPAFDCSMLPAPPLPSGATSLTMVVTLKVRDDAGNLSAEAINRDVRVLPKGNCGY